MYTKGHYFSIAIAALIAGCSGELKEPSSNFLTDDIEQLAKSSTRINHDSFIAKIDDYTAGASAIWESNYHYLYHKRQPYEGNSADIVKRYIDSGDQYGPNIPGQAQFGYVFGDDRKLNQAKYELDEFYRENGGLITVTLDLDYVEYCPDTKEACIEGPEIPLPFDSGKDSDFQTASSDMIPKILVKAFPVFKLEFDGERRTIRAKADFGPIDLSPETAEKLEMANIPGKLECTFRLDSMEGRFPMEESRGAKNIFITVDGIPDVPVPYLELLAARWIVDGDTLTNLTEFEIDPLLGKTAGGLFDMFHLPISLVNDVDLDKDAFIEWYRKWNSQYIQPSAMRFGDHISR